nr:MAG TPA: hypothetical protein [Caudoviricetes sp.]
MIKHLRAISDASRNRPVDRKAGGAFSMSSPPLGRCQSTVLGLSFLPQD